MNTRSNMTKLLGLAAMGCATAIWSPAVAAPWKFVMTGDGRGSSPLDPVNTNIMSEIVTAIVAEDPDLLVFPGDLVYSGSESAFRQWTNVVAPVYNAGIAVYPIRGNHDLPDDAAWTNVFGPSLPTNGPAGEVGFTYSFVHHNALFIGLDEYVTPHRVNQPWLFQQLSANRLPHVFVFGHEPAFKAFHSDCLDDYPTNRDAFWTSLSDAGVAMYLTGHDHFYDHSRMDDGDGNPSNDTHQIIAGTAGGPLYSFSGSYDGDNGRWTPTAVHNDSQYGYAVIEVDENNVTMTWKHRLTTNMFVAAEVFTYSSDQFSPTHHVSPSGGNIWPYLRRDTAATNIQDAVDAAVDGDVVLVDDGTYVLDRQIEITNKAVILRSINGCGAVTIDGNNTARCLHLAFSGAVVDGFTVSGGRGTGGGVLIDGHGELRNCVIRGNSASGFAGGICCDSGGLVLNCLVVSNSAGDCGGGLAILMSGTVENCTVSDNNAGSSGGGIYSVGSGESGIRVCNSILYGNLSATGSNYYNSGAGMDYFFCCAAPLVAGAGNIETPPLFVDAAAGNYRLQEDSPCIDGGTNLATITKDLDEASRPLDGDANGQARWDLGAYEFVHSTADTDLDGMRDEYEIIAGTDATNPASCFRITGILPISTNLAIEWESVLHRIYSVMTATNLVSAEWAGVSNPVFTNIPGTGQLLRYTNECPEDDSRFFRIHVWHK